MMSIAITLGEPAGIGPDILLKSAQHDLPTSLTVFADRDLLDQRAKQLGLSTAYSFTIKQIPLKKKVIPGKPDPANAEYVINTIKMATRACLEGECSALVTGPVNKAVINDAGIPFSGHTELLAELTNAPKPVMLMVSKNLRVALLTTHIPLSEVPAAVTSHNLIQTIEIITQDLKNKFGIQQPHILVCGLNPHASDHGHFGHEEKNIITPTLAALIKKGFHLTGPVSADTAFIKKPPADVILALYHDQGLPVIKTTAFGKVVNVTLGLPIVRTSVDHGTAFELAGTGKAREHSLLEAIQVARDLL